MGVVEDEVARIFDMFIGGMCMRRCLKPIQMLKLVLWTGML